MPADAVFMFKFQTTNDHAMASRMLFSAMQCTAAASKAVCHVVTHHTSHIQTSVVKYRSTPIDIVSAADWAVTNEVGAWHNQHA